MATLENKTILITGAAAGIGLATAKLAVERGASVIIADIDTAAGEKSAAELGATFLHVNMADESSVRKMFAEAEQKFGRLDALINAAGILKGAHVPLEEFDLATWQSIININLTGSFLCAKYAAPLIRKAGGGVIVLVSSLAAVLGSSSYAYGASKGGVNGLALTLERNLARDNIRVNVLMPGNIDTDMKRGVIAAEAKQRGESVEAAVAASHLVSPNSVAKILAWLVSDEADYVRGAISTR